MHCKHLGKVWERKRNIITSNEDAKDSLQPASVGGGAVQPNGFRNIKCAVVCVLERLRNTSKGENHQLLNKLRALVSKDLAGWMASYLLPF